MPLLGLLANAELNPHVPGENECSSLEFLIDQQPTIREHVRHAAPDTRNKAGQVGIVGEHLPDRARLCVHLEAPSRL